MHFPFDGFSCLLSVRLSREVRRRKSASPSGQQPRVHFLQRIFLDSLLTQYPILAPIYLTAVCVCVCELLVLCFNVLLQTQTLPRLASPTIRNWRSTRYQTHACPLAPESDMTVANYNTRLCLGNL